MYSDKYLEPIFKKNYTVIAMSSSDKYIPYLSVCLQSLVKHTSNNHNYDIVIFSSSENDNYKNTIIDYFSSDNISVRFYNPKHIFESINLKVTHSYFNEACYYRLAAPLVLKKYEKIIFTDIDLIFQADVKELYSIDLTGYPLAACKEPIWEFFIENNISIKDINIAKYSEEVLKLKDIKTYYNTGVVLFNIKEFNKNNYFNKLQKLINNTYFLYQEQCALNYLLNDKVFCLNNLWNYELHHTVNKDGCRTKQAKIIHYLGENKPWLDCEENMASIWWSYARQTPFYEEILSRMIDIKISQYQKNTQLIYIINNLSWFRIKKIWYKLNKNLAFNKHRRDKYKYKYKKIKQLIKNAKKLKKQILK